MSIEQNQIDSTSQRIYLVGFMGSGKSTLGNALASHLQWEFCDLDSLFEQQHQQTITEYFKTHGENAFRIAEQQAIRDTAHKNRVVYATGGGAPCFFDNMTQMNNNGITIYIKLNAEALVKRLHNGKATRPLIAEKSDGELLVFIEGKLAEREPFYNQSKIIVEDDGTLSVQGYVQLITSSIEVRLK